jgi:hypothetical protein
MFVTLKVFKLIGPSNDGRRHGRGTYLLNLARPQIPAHNSRCKIVFLSVRYRPTHSKNIHIFVE